MYNGLADSVWVGSKNKPAAAKWVEFLGSPECQDIVGDKAIVFPAIPSATDKAVAAFKAKGIDVTPFTDQVKDKTTFLFPITDHASEITDVMHAGDGQRPVRQGRRLVVDRCQQPGQPAVPVTSERRRSATGRRGASSGIVPGGALRRVAARAPRGTVSGWARSSSRSTRLSATSSPHRRGADVVGVGPGQGVGVAADVEVEPPVAADEAPPDDGARSRCVEPVPAGDRVGGRRPPYGGKVIATRVHRSRATRLRSSSARAASASA